MEASAMKLTVEVGGHPIGKVGNGKEISAEIDALRPCGATAGKTRTASNGYALN